jgi:hypothetical protein
LTVMDLPRPPHEPRAQRLPGPPHPHFNWGREWEPLRGSPSGGVLHVQDLALVAFGPQVDRWDAGLPDTFPGLLVANTFHRRQSLAERDRSVDPGVTRWAAQAHVMIVRTWDLVRLKVLKQYESPSHRRVRDGHKVQGEWYEVTDQLDSQVHPS